MKKPEVHGHYRRRLWLGPHSASPRFDRAADGAVVVTVLQVDGKFDLVTESLRSSTDKWN